MTAPFVRKCPACGGVRLVLGAIPDSGGDMLGGTNRMRFKPDGNWVTTHQLRALACRDCGHVGLWLQEGEEREIGGG